METDAAAVGEETECEERKNQQHATQCQPACLWSGIAQATLAGNGESHQQHRRRRQQLHQAEVDTVPAERPRMTIHQLETQASVGIIEIPQQQRQPRQRAEYNRKPQQRATQRRPALAQGQQRQQSDRHHRREAIVGQPADHQAQRQLRRHARIHLAQRARAGIQAQQTGQQQWHVRQSQHSQGARQWQQHQQQARQPTRSGVEFARGHPQHQPRQQGADQQERQPQRQRVVAAQRNTQSRQPRGQTGQVGIGQRKMLAFLPVKRLIDK